MATALSRSNNLFITKNWLQIYEALENVNFQAYSFETLVDAMINYIQVNYPEEFSDAIASSEFIMKVEIMAWLSQNISFRIDLNSRENFLATAERRDSLINLAYMIAYNVNRVSGGNGSVRVDSVMTTQQLYDSSGNNLRNTEVFWNSATNTDWYEDFILIMNSAFQNLCQFGTPVASYTNGSTTYQQYRLTSNAPTNGCYDFNATVNGITIPMEIINADLNTTTGEYMELVPNPTNTFSIFYNTDGQGFASTGTGFFLPLNQGLMQNITTQFLTPQILQTYTINVNNIDNNDVYVQQLDNSGNVITNWSQVDSTYSISTAFNTSTSGSTTIFEVDTLNNDNVVIRFGDGKFGQIPTGNFRFWYRTVDPTATPIPPVAIYKNTITIPYVNGGNLYYLTVKYSLQQAISNGTVTESNQSIRTRANKVFYTQNRMVNGQDLNSFYLNDDSILKVNVINRTYSGHSRYSGLTDPTALYSNAKIIGNDGRFYVDTTQNSSFYSADTTILSVSNLINQYISPLILKEDKKILYYYKYNEIFFPDSSIPTWGQNSIAGNSSRGNILLNGVIQPLGIYAASNTPYSYILQNSVLRYTDSAEDELTTGILLLVNDGTGTNGVVLDTYIPNNTNLISVMPPLRNVFTNAEVLLIQQNLLQNLDFAISWNQGTQTYQIITYNNIDNSNPFSIAYQGDNTGTYKDASWIIWFHYSVNAQGNQWEITDRGYSYYFESVNEIDFYYSNTENLVDPTTGTTVFDNIAILESNESKYSLRRRGLNTLITQSACVNDSTEFLANGIQTLFQTGIVNLNSNYTIVTVNNIPVYYNINWNIIKNSTGDYVSFFVAPEANSIISITENSSLIFGSLQYNNFISDGTTTMYNISSSDIISINNTFLFLDGIYQNPAEDYYMNYSNGNTIFILNEGSITSGVKIDLYSVVGIDTPNYLRTIYFGDGNTTNFSTNSINQNYNSSMVFIDGVLQDSNDYTISTINTISNIIFNIAPPLNTKIVLVNNNSNYYNSTQYFLFNTTSTPSQTFILPDVASLNANSIFLFIDGIYQEPSQYTIQGNNTILLNQSGLSSGLSVAIYVIISIIGQVLTSPVPNLPTSSINSINVSSCLVNFVGNDQYLRIYDVMKEPDGYIDVNGIAVSPVNSLNPSSYDNPYVFKDFVLADGVTDLVLWQQITQMNSTSWQALSNITSPAGSYSQSAFGGPTVGSPILSANNGDVHYDITLQQWLLANTTTGLWVLAPDQTIFKYALGRDNIRFLWTHYASDDTRIDPSPTNIHNAIILQQSYYDAYTSWIINNGDLSTEPQPPTSLSLTQQYSNYNQFKMLSDSIIYYPGKFKPLFGSRSDPTVQGQFKVIQSPGSNVAQNDLAINILSAINTYFSPDNFNFGDTFYLTELISYIHVQLSPDVQSIVLVPTDQTQAFGGLFQIRSEYDELFISVAEITDIIFVASFTNNDLNVGVIG